MTNFFFHWIVQKTSYFSPIAIWLATWKRLLETWMKSLSSTLLSSQPAAVASSATSVAVGGGEDIYEDNENNGSWRTAFARRSLHMSFNDSRNWSSGMTLKSFEVDAAGLENLRCASKFLLVCLSSTFGICKLKQRGDLAHSNERLAQFSIFFWGARFCRSLHHPPVIGRIWCSKDCCCEVVCQRPTKNMLRKRLCQRDSCTDAWQTTWHIFFCSLILWRCWWLAVGSWSSSLSDNTALK